MGIIFIPFHAAVLPLLLGIILALTDTELSSPYRMLVYYTVSFVLLLAIMFRFLRASFSDFIGDFWRAIQALILGYVFYRVLLWGAVFLLEQIMTEVNPNQEAVSSDIVANVRVMVIVTAVLAPIVEEAMFRGALFGTLRKKSRAAAYIVSVLLFCVFHLWDFLVLDFSWRTALYLIQYVPPSIALAWCYERSGTIWTPILLHSAINIMASFSVLG